MAWDILDESFENATNFDVAGWSATSGNGSVDPNSAGHAFAGLGNECLALNSTGANYSAYINRTFNNDADIYGELHFYVANESLADGNSIRLMVSYDTDWHVCPVIYLQQQGANLVLYCVSYFDAGDHGSTSSALATETEYTIRWKYDNTGNSFQWLLNNNSVSANTFTTGTGGLRYLYVGPATGGTENSVLLYVDGIRMSSTNWVDEGGGFNANNYVRLRWTK